MQLMMQASFDILDILESCRDKMAARLCRILKWKRLVNGYEGPKYLHVNILVTFQLIRNAIVVSCFSRGHRKIWPLVGPLS